MNHTYRSIYNETLNTYIATAETSKTKGKTARSAVLAALMTAAFGLPSSTYATLYPGDMTTVDCTICIDDTSGNPVDITTNGNLTSYNGSNIDAYVSGDITINTAAKKTLNTALGHSIVVMNISDNSNTTINNASAINSNRGGISVLNFIGDIAITNTGAITDGSFANGSWGYGIEAETSRGNIIVKNSAAITAGTGSIGTSNAAGDTTVNNNAALNAGDTGINVFNWDGNTQINNSGDISTTATTNGIQYIDSTGIEVASEDHFPPAAIHVDNRGGNVVIKSSGQYTVTGDGIKVINTTNDGDVTGSTTIVNNANISTSHYTADVSQQATNGTWPTPISQEVIGNGIDVLQATGGSTITNTGSITVESGGLVIKGGDAIEKVTTTAGTLTGNINLGRGDDSFTASGGALVGSTFMGAGKDTLTLSGTVSVNKTPQLDGGAGTDTLNLNGVTLRGFTAASNDATDNNLASKGTNLTTLEAINVQNKGTLKLSNNLFTAANTGLLSIDATSMLNLKGNSPSTFTINGNVNNAGTMTMQDGAADDVTTITGNYIGTAGSTYKIDTKLGDDNSPTDKLIVKGNTSGTTALSVTNIGGTGAQTVNGISVVQVDGTSATGSFTMATPLQAGSYEYTLQQGSTVDSNDWYLRKQFTPTCANTPSMCYTYRPAVAMYVVAASANKDAAALQLSSLHQRLSEQHGLTTDKLQTWARTFGASASKNGHSRFEYDQYTYGAQFGHDILAKTSPKDVTSRAGVILNYTHSKLDARDRIRPLAGLGKDTGTMQSDAIGLGGYYSQMSKDGAYLDVIGQMSHIHNQFRDSYAGHSSQKGWQTAASVEIGKPMASIGAWQAEPQAQLSYVYTKLNGFNDKYSHVSGSSNHGLTARLGLRLYHDSIINKQAAQHYVLANVVHNLLGEQSTRLYDHSSSDSIRADESFDRSFFEIGGGLQGQVGKNTFIYGDARYQRSFRGNSQGAAVNLGVKTKF